MSPSQRNSASARLRNYGSVTNAVKAMEQTDAPPEPRSASATSDLSKLSLESLEQERNESSFSPELDLLFPVFMERLSSGPESGALCHKVIYNRITASDHYHGAASVFMQAGINDCNLQPRIATSNMTNMFAYKGNFSKEQRRLDALSSRPV